MAESVCIAITCSRHVKGVGEGGGRTSSEYYITFRSFLCQLRALKCISAFLLIYCDHLRSDFVASFH